jgi:hypothetical protein
MDPSEFARSLAQVWRESPGTILLLLIGIVGFVVTVIDTWHYRRKLKRKRPD